MQKHKAETLVNDNNTILAHLHVHVFYLFIKSLWKLALLGMKQLHGFRHKKETERDRTIAKQLCAEEPSNILVIFHM